MSDERTHRLIPAVWVFIVNDEGKYFLLRRANTGWLDGAYVIPSGHIEKNETPRVAGARELEEEAGVRVDVDQLEFAHVVFNKSTDGTDTERVSIFLRATSYEGTPHLAEPEKADHAEWFSPHNLPEMPEILKQVIDHIERGSHYSELYY